jgi:lysophospholipase L1-like esterase
MYFYPARGAAFNLKNLGKDGVHPSDDGYQILSNTISRALGWYMWKSGNLNKNSKHTYMIH